MNANVPKVLSSLILSACLSGCAGGEGGVTAEPITLTEVGDRVVATICAKLFRCCPATHRSETIDVGTDDPRQLTANLVRDQLAAGHTMVTGGIYVDARLGTAGPGDTVAGVALDARVGGSPFNAAVGLARLGQPVAFFSAVSRGFLGERLIRALAAEGLSR